MNDPALQVYEISHDSDRLNEYERNFDAVLIDPWEPDQKALSRTWSLTDPILVNSEIKFQGYADVLQQVDYPSCTHIRAIMSKRMIDVFHSLGTAPEHIVPIIMHAFNDLDEEELREDREQSDTVFDDFYAVQLLSHSDLFDSRKSKCDFYERAKGCKPGKPLIHFIRRLVLKPVPEGYPPLFRLTAKPITLYISGIAKAALESAGIKGVSFYHKFDAEEYYGL